MQIVTCGSIPLESSFQRCQGVYMFPQSCMNTKDGEGHPLMLSTVASLGGVVIPRNTWVIFIYRIFNRG